jgi:hypothetical protein
MVWDYWHDWEPRFISLVLPKIMKRLSSEGMQRNYCVGGESRVILGAGLIPLQILKLAI